MARCNEQCGQEFENCVPTTAVRVNVYFSPWRLQQSRPHLGVLFRPLTMAGVDVEFNAMILCLSVGDDKDSFTVEQTQQVNVFSGPDSGSTRISHLPCYFPIHVTRLQDRFAHIRFQRIHGSSSLEGWVHCKVVGDLKQCGNCGGYRGWQLLQLKHSSWIEFNLENLFIYYNYDPGFAPGSDDDSDDGAKSDSTVHMQGYVCIAMPNANLEGDVLAHTTHWLHLTLGYIEITTEARMLHTKHHLRYKLWQSLEAVRKRDRVRLRKNATWLRFIKRLDICAEPCLERSAICTLSDAEIAALHDVGGLDVLAQQRREHESSLIQTCMRIRARDRAREAQANQLIDMALGEPFQARGRMVSNSCGIRGNAILRLLFYILADQLRYRLAPYICMNDCLFRLLDLDQAHLTDNGAHYVDLFLIETPVPFGTAFGQ